MSTVETLEKGVRLTIKIPEWRGWVKIFIGQGGKIE